MFLRSNLNLVLAEGKGVFPLKVVTKSVANDNKLGRTIDTLEGEDALQRELDSLEHWAIANYMKFNKYKGQILHLGWCNHGPSSRVGYKMLVSRPAERDLLVLFDGNLNMSQQFALIAKMPSVSMECIFGTPNLKSDCPTILSIRTASPLVMYSFVLHNIRRI